MTDESQPAPPEPASRVQIDAVTGYFQRRMLAAEREALLAHATTRDLHIRLVELERENEALRNEMARMSVRPPGKAKSAARNDQKDTADDA